tara:strand:- start:1720 stop:3627 length:1908 start_codon:yes stop_codon:yes gene_type:complete
MKSNIFLIIFLLISNTLIAESSNEYNFEGNRVSLFLAEKKDNTLNIGLDFKLKDNWHIYWIYPGDAGEAPKINIVNQTGTFKGLSVKWPFPQEYIDKKNEIITRIYKNRVIIPIQIKQFKDKNIEETLKTKIEYQICDEICIPLSTKLDLKIPSNNYIDKNKAELLKRFKERAPVNLPESLLEKKQISYYKNSIEVKIRLNKNSQINKKDLKNSKAILYGKDLKTYRNTAIKIKNNEVKYTFKSFEQNIRNKNINDILVFVSLSDKNYFWKDKLNIQKNSALDFTLLSIILISFVGGLILNFMPCVLPVLGLKISNFFKQLEYNEHNTIKKSSLSVSLGIILTFMFFALFVIGLRALGENIGWGIQFQQPFFLIFLIIILGVFILNLLGYLTIRMPSIFYKIFKIKTKRKKTIFWSNFSTGVISTILATPCTAPFVGTAVSFALAQNNIWTLMIFFMMALGKASPYFIFIIFPNIIDYFPRPGKWMSYIKYIFALMLFGTIVWLFSILLQHFNNNSVEEVNGFWKNFEIAKIKENLSNDRAIFVDITADWCITCKVNKKMVLQDREVLETLNKKNVIKLRGDWTLQNQEITKYLESIGKFGIPLNILYSPSNPNGYVFSEILNKKELIFELNKLE